MCYDDNARPPLPPKANGSARGEDLVLQASDGNRFSAYVARPEHPSGAQILIFPDVRGLHQFYKELALRFAETGTTALAIDYFGRTAGLTERNDAFEFWPHVQQLNVQTSFNDVQAALAYLRQNNSKQPIFTVGFCMGGSFSLLAATRDLGQAGAIGFYANLSRVIGGSAGSVLDLASQICYPVLGLFGGADPGIPTTDIQALDTNLDKQASNTRSLSTRTRRTASSIAVQPISPQPPAMPGGVSWPSSKPTRPRDLVASCTFCLSRAYMPVSSSISFTQRRLL